MIPTIPPVADTDTPPVASFASRFVATRWIDSPTFSNFTTGVATVADVMAPVEDDVPGAGAPRRMPKIVTPKFATEKSGKFVFASMLLATGTVTPLAEIDASVNCLDVVFTLIVTSPFTSAKSVTLTISVPVAYRTMPGVIAVGAGSGFSSVRITPMEPPVADTDTPPVASFASRFVATRWIDSPTFSNFTTGVATVAEVMAPVADDVPGAGAPSRNPNTVAPKFATEKSTVVLGRIGTGTGTRMPPAAIEGPVNAVALVFSTAVTSPFTSAKSVTLTISVPVAYSTSPVSSITIPTEALFADTDTPPTSIEATAPVTAIRTSLPTFSKPKFPDSFRKPPISKLRPVPETAETPSEMVGTLTVMAPTPTVAAVNSAPVVFCWTVTVPVALSRLPPVSWKSPRAYTTRVPSSFSRTARPAAGSDPDVTPAVKEPLPRVAVKLVATTFTCPPEASIARSPLMSTNPGMETDPPVMEAEESVK